MPTSLAILCALFDEASPIIDYLAMKEVPEHFDKRLGLKLFISQNYPTVALVLFGKCEHSGANKIGTQIASLACWETIKTLNPNMLASVGTAGGFKGKGAAIGDVFLSEKYIYFHGRHISAPGYQIFERGRFPVIQLSVSATIKLGTISSGDSVPVSEIDLKRMEELGTDAKDMEAAAIAEVACMANKPIFALKSITDFVDSQEPTYEQFSKNFSLATKNLTLALGALLTTMIHPTIVK